MGSDESHLTISVGNDGQSHKTVSTNQKLFEEKGKPKRYQTVVLPLTSLTPYRWAKPADSIAALAAAVALTRKGDTNFPQGIKNRPTQLPNPL